MTVVNVSYNVPRPKFGNPEEWLKKINHSTGILESMAREGSFRVIAIYNTFFRGVIDKNGVEYHFSDFSFIQLLFPFRYNGYVRRLNPGVVIVHGLRSPWQVILLRWQLGRHVMIIGQNHAEKPFYDWRKYFQVWADRFIRAYLFTSRTQGEEWLRMGLIVSEKKINEVMEASSEFGVVTRKDAIAVTGVVGTQIYLWVGGLDTNKDPLLLLEAFAQFASDNPSCHLYMIFRENTLLPNLNEWLIQHPDIKKNIHLVGEVEHDQLKYWYSSAEFIVSTSHYEGSGIAVCEAMSCGCVPLLTNIASFKMMSDNGAVGILFEPGDVSSLELALTKSLSLNLAEEKKKVLKLFADRLSFDAIAKKIADVIQARS